MPAAMLGASFPPSARMDAPQYKTTDVYLSAFLLSEGAALQGRTRLAPKRVEFRFRADERLHELLRWYWRGQPLPLVPARLFASLRTLKGRGQD
jgi:hypothetical protein